MNNKCPISSDGKHQFVEATREDLINRLKNFDDKRAMNVCGLINHLQLHTNYDKETVIDLAYLVFFGMDALNNEQR